MGGGLYAFDFLKEYLSPSDRVHEEADLYLLGLVGYTRMLLPTAVVCHLHMSALMCFSLHKPSLPFTSVSHTNFLRAYPTWSQAWCKSASRKTQYWDTCSHLIFLSVLRGLNASVVEGIEVSRVLVMVCTHSNCLIYHSLQGFSPS